MNKSVLCTCQYPRLPTALQCVSLESVCRAVVAQGLPIARATQAEAVRLHDDKVCGWQGDKGVDILYPRGGTFLQITTSGVD